MSEFYKQQRMKTNLWKTFVVVGLTLAGSFLPAVSRAEAAPPLYIATFETNAVGPVPDEFLVLDGQFTIKEEGGSKFLELPGAPLDSYGILFGPTEPADVLLSAKIYGTGKGRRFPAFGLGANGVGGYRVQVSPAKKQLELFRGDEVKQGVAYEWKSGQWTELRLEVRKGKDNEFHIRAKAWTKGEAEPKEWMLTLEDKEPLPPGRAAVTGSPYAGTEIRFDDLTVSRAEAKP